MHPAFSVLIFTVTSGAGYGLLAWLGAGQLLGYTQAQTTDQQIVLGVIGMLLVSIGLLSSTMHLANPKNAWPWVGWWTRLDAKQCKIIGKGSKGLRGGSSPPQPRPRALEVAKKRGFP